MNYNTQNNLLVITRDNELAPEYLAAVRKQRISNVLAATTGFLGKAVEYTAEKLETATMPVYLDLQDARLGTSLRDEYFAKKRNTAIAHIREIVEL